MRTEENIAAVSAIVNDDHQLLIRRCSQQLGFCYSTTCKILRKDLGMKPFKIQLVFQTFNYMDRTIDSNKDFSEFGVFLKNFPIALKKSQ